MTKLEFLDRINDILIGLNTAESDALGSLYDELMRDAGWHPASELPPVDGNGNSKVLFAVDKFGCLERVYYHEEPERNLGYWVVSRDYNLPELVFNTKWWCYPPNED